MTRLIQSSTALMRIGLEKRSTLSWEGAFTVEGQEPGMSEKPGRDFRKRLSLDLNYSA